MRTVIRRLVFLGMVALLASTAAVVADWARSQNALAQEAISITVSETITVSDTSVVSPPAIIDVTETVTVSDTPVALPILSLNVAETVTVSDAPVVSPPAIIGVTETVTVSDTPVVLSILSLDVAETITASDVPTVSPPAIVNVTETVTVSDTPTVTPPAIIGVTETVTVSDTPVVLSILSLDVAETITASDVPTVSAPAIINVTETVTVSDTPVASLPAIINVTEMVTVSDMVTPTPPSVMTNPVSSVSTTSAIINGTLASMGTATSVNVSFVWGTTLGGPYPNSTTPQKMGAPGAFSTNLTGLSPDTKHYFRAKADGGIDGIHYGVEMSFTTLSSCFIATAAYGTDTAEQINVLRQFRDNVLKQSRMGTAFVSFYYRVSPPIAEFISQHEILRTIAREGLIEPIVHIVELSRSLWSGKSG